jgi:hypothetical protein
MTSKKEKEEVNMDIIIEKGCGLDVHKETPKPNTPVKTTWILIPDPLNISLSSTPARTTAPNFVFS